MKEKYIKAKPYIDKIGNILLQVAYAVLIAYVIVNISDSSQEMYQTWKDVEASKALVAFAIFMCLVQRVKLLNWQTLVYSAIYWPLGVWFLKTHMYGETLEMVYENRVWFYWILGLIVVDMLVYRRANKLMDFKQSALLIYLAMAIFMLTFRNGRGDPLVLILPMFVFYMISISKSEWEKIQNAFCNGWLIAFIIIVYRSFTLNPYEGGRWFGSFLNIGAFSMFLGCVFAVAFYRILQSKEKYGRKSIAYVASWVWLAATVAIMLLVNTRTMWLGVACMVVAYVIFVGKKKTAKELWMRVGYIAIALAILLIVGLIAMKLVSGVDVEKLRATITNKYLLAPIEYFVMSARGIAQRAGEQITPINTVWDNIYIYLNEFSSDRIAIWRGFANAFSFTGNPSAGIQVGTYFATNAHNQYVQVVYEYGFLGGGCWFLWMIYITVKGIKDYFKSWKSEQILIVLWMFTLFGMFWGEMANFFYPEMYATLILFYPQIVRIKEESEKGRKLCFGLNLSKKKEEQSE